MNSLTLKTQPNRAKAKSTVFFSRRELASVIVGASGFFIGRAVVFSFVNPLCVAFLATFMGGGHTFYLTALFLALGLATRFKELLIARYLLALGLLCVGETVTRRLILSGRMPKPKLLFQAAASAVCMLAAGLTAAVVYDNSPFLYLVAVIETVLTGSVFLIVKRATVILTTKRRSRLLSGEDLIALAAVLAGVIAGASDIHVGGVPLRYFLCLYVLMITACKGGASMGASAGMLLGFFLHMAGYWDISMGVVLGIAGMTGGFLKKYGRLAVIGGVAVAGGAALALLARSQAGFPPVYALIAAGLALMLTPQDFYFNIASTISPTLDTVDDYMDKIKEETTRRLDAFAGAFEKLAGTFSGLSKPKTALNKTDISQLIDDLSNRACQGCPDYKRCWESEFYQTYTQVYALLNICVKKGAAERSDIENAACINAEVLLRELNTVFALYHANLRWNNRIAESRELVSQQLHGVAGIIRGLSEEIDLSLKFHEGLEEEMIAALLRHKIEVNSVIVLENKAGKYQVTVSHKPCAGRHVGICGSEMLPVLGAVLKRRMRVESPDCDIKKGICAARFVEDQKLRVTGGVAHRAKSSLNGSGDSYSFMELKNGQCLLVLSDGMGSGERARRESAATVGLLEDFMESGFDKALAVRMINSVLVLKSSEESFSTLDICALDLYTGDAEFIKIGASSTFLLRNGKVSVVRSSSLPMGMLNNVDLEVSARKLTHNDIVLMVTDGVLDAADGQADKEGWLSETLRGCRHHNPQDVADYILAEAERASGGLPRDDMTVLAARVWERM